ncbi:hypothetical protein CSE_06820 [Caldisericum exile AZM16c01]|uniref:Uncharacterized protein n=1 Tax=Caldisericum exile (strain DSM 21853 / NBRC 104410 / AZM16c01) TaxID=511051 RepID=A0A7U6JET7_CALEA|nr:hypothetical protein CSE_06820 [Caldisericum exile AZM16c01]
MFHLHSVIITSFVKNRYIFVMVLTNLRKFKKFKFYIG